MAAFIDDQNMVQIQCNVCREDAPPVSEIIKAGGLQNMGWYCVGGIHLCPKHADERESTL
jgi:hypothetical protein